MIILPIIYLISAYTSRYIVTLRLFKKFDGLLRISSSVIIGTLISGWITLILSSYFYVITDNSLFKGSILTMTLFLLFIILQRRYLLSKIKLNSINITLLSICLILSYLLFPRTFQFDHSNGTIEISRLIWSDYIFHLHSIRTFSLGENIILDNPLFGNDRFRYHFMVYFLFGTLEKLGFQIDYAINIPSSLFFTSLIISTYYLAKNLFFNNILTGILTSIFFLFNNSLSFFIFIKDHYNESPLTFLKSIWKLSDFISYRVRRTDFNLISLCIFLV